MAPAAYRIFFCNQDWKNGVTLYTYTLAQQPDADAILNNLGNIYWTEGNLPGAKREWDNAYRMRQNVPAVLNNLGLYYAKEGDVALDAKAGRNDLAQKEYRAALGRLRAGNNYGK
ncbi:MAG: hypothetical protein KGM47_02190 [Acidobacteriota bacterium]|nr:hypothetical protein [Acidobacteriota bacterium]